MKWLPHETTTSFSPSFYHAYPKKSNTNMDETTYETVYVRQYTS